MTTDPRREFVESLLGGDSEKAISFIHPECVTRHPPTLPYGGDLMGPEGYRQLQDALWSTFDLDLEKTDVRYVDDDHVLVRFWATFIHKVTRKTAKMTVAEIYRFEDGMCVEQDNYYKSPELVTALILEAQRSVDVGKA
ncbi:nuclear transport factor 2 family protein (plasmid) [Nocardioides sp. R1-1]|uniref:nuclear transport factor 2 family protein n=1 Tax=Nocardioides sp. R1-1 TaxID=3383502 RepID=UPI0038D0954E